MTYIAKDQYGHFYGLYSNHPRKELMEKFCRQHSARIYRDTDDPHKPLHIGYIIAGLWLTVYGVEGRKFAKVI